jgi:hypothetical protein
VRVSFLQRAVVAALVAVVVKGLVVAELLVRVITAQQVSMRPLHTAQVVAVVLVQRLKPELAQKAVMAALA